MVWLSDYFQHLGPTFKNQDISHKKFSFPASLKNSEALAALGLCSHETTLLPDYTRASPVLPAYAASPPGTLRMAKPVTLVCGHNWARAWLSGLCVHACAFRSCAWGSRACMGSLRGHIHVKVCRCAGEGVAPAVAMWSVWATAVWHTPHRGLFRPLRGNRIPGFWLDCLVGFISVLVPTGGLSNGNI